MVYRPGVLGIADFVWGYAQFQALQQCGHLVDCFRDGKDNWDGLRSNVLSGFD